MTAEILPLSSCPRVEGDQYIFITDANRPVLLCSYDGRDDWWDVLKDWDWSDETLVGWIDHTTAPVLPLSRLTKQHDTDYAVIIDGRPHVLGWWDTDEDDPDAGFCSICYPYITEDEIAGFIDFRGEALPPQNTGETNVI